METFTAETLKAVLKRYILRSKLTDEDILKLSEHHEKFDPLQIITDLIENSDGRLDRFAPAEELLEKLQVYYNSLPKSSKLLNLPNVMNYEREPNVLTTTKGCKYISIDDLLLIVYRKLTLEVDPENILLKSMLEYVVLNFYEDNSKQYELVPYSTVDTTWKQLLTDIEKIHENPLESVRFAESIDGDQSLSHLVDIAMSKYSDKHNSEALQISTVFHEHFDMLLKTLKSNHEENPVVRLFGSEKSVAKFFMSYELKMALKKYEEIEIEVETEEDRKNGIVRTISYVETEELLKKAGIDMDYLNIIEIIIDGDCDYYSVISPFGNHCKWAFRAISEIFDVIINKFRWFDTTKKENVSKIFRWFEKVRHIFSETREYRFFIEIWKIDEIIELAHKDLQKYCAIPAIEIEKSVKLTEKKEVYDVLMKISTGVKINEKYFDTNYEIYQKAYNVELWDKYAIQGLYDLYWQMFFFQGDAKFCRFRSIQVSCTTFEGLPCPCQKKETTPVVTEQTSSENAKLCQKFVKQLPKLLNSPDFNTDNPAAIMKTLKNIFGPKEVVQLESMLKNVDVQKMFKQRQKTQLKQRVAQQPQQNMEKKSSKKEAEVKEQAKVVTKFVTETRIVESCEKCRDIKEEIMTYLNKIRDLEMKNEENERNIKKKDEDILALKNQTSQNKLKYRDEIQKHKDDVECRDLKIEQLQQELKEFREDLKAEREKSNIEARENSKLINDRSKKLENELENMKFLDRNNKKIISDLQNEITHLNITIENLEGNEKELQDQLEHQKSKVPCEIIPFSKQEDEEGYSFDYETAEEDFDEFELSETESEPDLEQLLRIETSKIIEIICSKFGSKIPAELTRFRRQFDVYIQILEMELRKGADLSGLPEIPSPFSNDVMRKFEIFLRNQNKVEEICQQVFMPRVQNRGVV